MRIPNRFLPHRVTVEPYAPLGGGRKWEAAGAPIRAQVEDTRKMVVDQRPDSDSIGQAVMAATRVITHRENWATPGSRVTIWAGTPREQKLIILNASYYEHNIAPNSAELWLV